MKYQRGLSLSGLIVWGIVIALVAILGMRVVPDVIDYYKIKKIVASTAHNADGKTVQEIRAIFDKYADIDSINTIKGVDLDISKEGNAVVVGFAYERRIPLFPNVALVIDFQGSSGRN